MYGISTVCYLYMIIPLHVCLIRDSRKKKNCVTSGDSRGVCSIIPHVDLSNVFSPFFSVHDYHIINSDSYIQYIIFYSCHVLNTNTPPFTICESCVMYDFDSLLFLFPRLLHSRYVSRVYSHYLFYSWCYSRVLLLSCSLNRIYDRCSFP